MKNCTNCGFELSDEALFCSKCGTKVEVLSTVSGETVVTVSDKEVVGNILKLEETWYKNKKAYDDFKIGEYPHPKPNPPEKPICPKGDLIPEPVLELEEFVPPKVQLPPLPTPPVLTKKSAYMPVMLTSLICCICSCVSLLFIGFHDVSSIYCIGLFVVSVIGLIIASRLKPGYNKALADNARLKQEYLQNLAKTKDYARQLIADAHEKEKMRVDEINRTRRLVYTQKYNEVVKKNQEIMTPIYHQYDKTLAEWREGPYARYIQRTYDWEDAKKEWIAERKAMQNEKYEIYKQSEKELLTYIHETHLVPSTYLPYGSLSSIYETLRTSNFTIKEAIELYDRALQREVTISAGKSVVEAIQSISNSMGDICSIMNEQTQIMFDQAQMQAANNSLLDEQLEVAYKTNRDVAIGNVVGGIQRHNTNKKLGKLMKKL